VLPLADPVSRIEAARLAAAGRPIGLFLGGLCVALGDGGQRAFAEWTIRSKGEGRIGRPMATILPAREVVPLVDPEAIAPAFRPLLLDAAELVARLGALVFVRLPVQEAAARTLPPWLLSRSADGRPLFQFMDPSGSDPVRRFMEALLDEGIRYPAGSSMNVSGRPELVRREEGIAFARATGIPLFLSDRVSPIGVTGSYPILHFDQAGVRLVREGPVPGWVFERLLEQPVDTAAAKPAKYPQLSLDPSLLAGLRPREVREAVLLRLGGWSDVAIRSQVQLG
jgi:hypothetical protein